MSGSLSFAQHPHLAQLQSKKLEIEQVADRLMIIEFIGSTGAGKTTLISKVQHKLAKTVNVTTSFDLVSTPVGLRGVTNPTAQNLIQELVGFPFFVHSLHRHKAFVVFALKMLARHGKFTFYAMNYLRSLERTVGVYEIIRRYERKRIVLVDEGTILPAHNVFVYTNAEYTPEEIARFAALVPLPDLIVYVKAPVDCIIERSRRRTDPPREMKSKDHDQIEVYVNRAVNKFEQLVRAEPIRSRTLIAENFESTDKERDVLANDIAAFILNNWPVGQRVQGVRTS